LGSNVRTGELARFWIEAGLTRHRNGRTNPDRL
jgi:hypothetical protein